MRLLRFVPAVAAALLSGAPCGTAGAQDLQTDADRLEAEWKKSSRVVRLPPRFLVSNQSFLVPAGRGAKTPDPAGCIAVAILGERTASFGIYFSRPGVAARDTQPAVRSTAGAAMITRCGADRRDASEMLVRMLSGRGALEVVVAESEKQPIALETVLPERQPGPSAMLVDVGPPPDVDSLPVRIADAERRVISAGGRLLPRRQLKTAPGQSSGAVAVDLADGCHRLVLLPDTGPGRVGDVDVELHDLHDRVLGRDRSSATDAALDVCVGEATPAMLAFAGGAKGSSITLLHGTWAIPAGIPEAWGPRARAALAAAHRRRPAPMLSRAPVWQGEGLAGRTVIPIELDPEGCYSFAVATTRGEPRGMRVAARVGASNYVDVAVAGAEGSVLAFCAQGQTHVRADLEVSGANTHWTAGLWRTGTRALGAAEPW